MADQHTPIAPGSLEKAKKLYEQKAFKEAREILNQVLKVEKITLMTEAKKRLLLPCEL